MPLNSLLLSSNMHFILFGGKGGVGKTSCAAAAAIWAADHGKKVLVISTDPAHSLADSLGQKLPLGEVTKIEEVENLWGLEIKPKMESTNMGAVMENISPELAPLIGSFGDLNSMNPPGIDEAMAFGKVLEFLQDSQYDLIIFDTAPTGHTLRLLSIPDMLSGWMGKLITMKLKMGKLLAGFKSIFTKQPNDDADALESLNHLKAAVDAAKEELSDPTRTSFVIVMISELMAIYETERLLSALMSYDISVKHMIVNQLIPENNSCDFCINRRNMQLKHLKEIKSLYTDEFDLIEVELYPQEVRKIDLLRKFARLICGD